MISKSATQQELKDIGIEQPIQNIVSLYDKYGKLCEEENKSVAKTVQISSENKETVLTTYYVKHGRGQLFDPYGLDMNKTKAFDFQFRKVDKEIFEAYSKYLQTRREVYLISARRLFINKGY